MPRTPAQAKARRTALWWICAATAKLALNDQRHLPAILDSNSRLSGVDGRARR